MLGPGGTILHDVPVRRSVCPSSHSAFIKGYYTCKRGVRCVPKSKTTSSSHQPRVLLRKVSPGGHTVSICCCCCRVASVVSDSVRPHRRQPTRLPGPWDSPGKNAGVGCHFLLQYSMIVWCNLQPKGSLNYGVGEDSSESLGLQGDLISPF